MYTIKNLVDDKNIFPYEYGVTSRDECSSQLIKFYQMSKELRSEVDNCSDFMTKSGTRHFMN